MEDGLERFLWSYEKYWRSQWENIVPDTLTSAYESWTCSRSPNYWEIIYFCCWHSRLNCSKSTHHISTSKLWPSKFTSQKSFLFFIEKKLICSNIQDTFWRTKHVFKSKFIWPCNALFGLANIFGKPSACYEFCLIYWEAACMKNKGKEHSTGKGSLVWEIWPILC